MLKSASELDKGAIIFGYKVKDANQFGVIDFDKNMNIISIEKIFLVLPDKTFISLFKTEESPDVGLFFKTIPIFLNMHAIILC